VYRNSNLVHVVRPKIPPARNILGMTGQQAIARIPSARSMVPRFFPGYTADMRHTSALS